MARKDTPEYKTYMREYRRRYRLTQNGIAKLREARKRYEAGQAGKARGRIRKRRQNQKLKIECLKRYGGDPPKCACCGEANIGFLTLDHVNGDGNKHRLRINGTRRGGNTSYRALKRAGFPNDPPLQVLCFNCNCGRELNAGVCPHVLGGMKAEHTPWHRPEDYLKRTRKKAIESPPLLFAVQE